MVVVVVVVRMRMGCKPQLRATPERSIVAVGPTIILCGDGIVCLPLFFFSLFVSLWRDVRH